MEETRKFLVNYKVAVQCVLLLLGVVLMIAGVLVGANNAAGISLLSIGAAVATTGVISIVLTIFASESLERDLNTKKLVSSLIAELQPKLLAQLTELGHSVELEHYGVIGVVKALETEDIANKMQVCRDRISFLDTWFCEDFARVKRGFDAAAAKHVPVEVIILKPDEIAKLRSRALGESDDYVSENIFRNLKAFSSLAQSLSNLTVRITDELPSIQISLFDNEAYVGFFLHQVESSSGTQLKVAMMRDGKPTRFGEIIQQELSLVSGSTRTETFIKEGVPQKQLPPDGVAASA